MRSVGSKGNAGQVIRLVLAFEKGSVPKSQVSQAVEALTSVKELSLQNLTLTSLAALNGFKGQLSFLVSEYCFKLIKSCATILRAELEILTMEKVLLYNRKTCFTLPQLHSLTVGDGCSIELANFGDRNTPKLSALALRRKTDLEGWYPSLSSSTPWNLAAFFLNWDSSYRYVEPLPKVLVTVQFWELQIDEGIGRPILDSGIRHLRVYQDAQHLQEPYLGLSLGILEKIVKIIRDKPTPFETLLLPPQFHPFNFSVLTSPLRVPEREPASEPYLLLQNLAQECLDRGTELIYEEQSDRKLNSDISKAFLRKMKRLASQ
jgi:hypothetical protein